MDGNGELPAIIDGTNNYGQSSSGQNHGGSLCSSYFKHQEQQITEYCEKSGYRCQKSCNDAAATGDVATTTANADSHKNEVSEAPAIHIHPLLIEHVSKKIFSFFNWSYRNSNMLSCRQVCKTWCNVITNRMKRRGLVRQIRFPHYEGEGEGDSDTRPSDQFEKFVSDMRHTSNLPFDDFSFDDVHFFTKRNTQHFNEFLKLFGPDISSLKLKFGKHYSMELVDSFMDYQLMSFSSLKKFTFECSHLFTVQGEIDERIKRSSFTWQPIHPRELAQGLVSLFKAVLSSAPQLEELNLYLPARYLEGEDSHQANSKFGEILAESLADSVINLKLTLQLNESHLHKLGSRILKLRKLDLEFYGSHLHDRCLKDFIHSQSKSLVHLRLVDFENILGNIDRLNLKECSKAIFLTVKGNQFSFSSLEKFPPNLESLALFTPPKKMVNSENTDNEKTQNFTISEIEFQYPIDNGIFISNLANHLPNLTTLKIQANPESTKGVIAVFQHLSKLLVHFEITFLESFSTQTVDTIFTGISQSTCCMILDEGMYSGQDQRRLLAEISRRPSLENLQKMKKLVIKAESTALMLTDVSVHYAFFHCPSLQEIIFDANHQISSDCFHLLRTRLNITQEGTQTTSGQSSESMENCWALVPVHQ